MNGGLQPLVTPEAAIDSIDPMKMREPEQSRLALRGRRLDDANEAHELSVDGEDLRVGPAVAVVVPGAYRDNGSNTGTEGDLGLLDPRPCVGEHVDAGSAPRAI